MECNILLVVETDAEMHSLAASLNQAGRPDAFFSRTLSHSEQKWQSFEKEACAMVEALQKWRQFLLGVTRLSNIVRVRNLLYSVEEIKEDYTSL